ncbi:hypothetical protein [Alteromonas sp. CYL-A6]|uniref:hypothetical protein n=1 Tax=Alteromonas nitratireducens TaxID=3390813 RepID=UPI0034BA2F9D
MNINVTLYGQGILVLAIILGGIGYYLGKRKTENPALTAVIGFFCAFFPPFGAIFIIVLALKKDIVSESKE